MNVVWAAEPVWPVILKDSADEESLLVVGVGWPPPLEPFSPIAVPMFSLTAGELVHGDRLGEVVKEASAT